MYNKALLIGINYKGTTSELQGCINDVNNMSKYLVNIAGYLDSDIRIMSDDQDGDNIPTYDNISKGLYELAVLSHKEDIKTIFIHYSGHGTSLPDENGDENDKKDEAICPLDYEKSGFIVDDTLNHLLSLINKTTKVIIVMDCCHSGSILDLNYKYIDKNNNMVFDNIKTKKIESEVLVISGCRDDQTSADAYIDNDFAGALTNTLLSVLKDYNYDITCFKLLQQINLRLKTGKQKYTQIAQMTSSVKLTSTSIFSYNRSEPQTFMKAIKK